MPARRDGLPDLPDLPHHRHFARAIVEAARATSEDPIGIAQGDMPSRGRSYAYWALVKLFPRATGAPIASCLGCHQVKTEQARMYASRTRKWWDPEWVDLIADAVAAEPPPAPVATELAPAMPRPVTVVAPVLRPGARIIDRRLQGNFTACLMGDPDPSRSALGQRQRQEH